MPAFAPDLGGSQQRMSNGEENQQSHRSTGRSRSRGEPRRMVRWPLLRLMGQSPAFRLVVLVFLLGAIGGPLLVLKLWRVTPPGVTPVERISLLDRIQAWSLKRQARAATERGDYEAAKSVWRAALANNPADPEGLREALKVVARTAQPAESASLALGIGGWLLRMGQTNIVSDLELIASVWNLCELHERSALLLSQATNAVSPTLNRLKAVAYFRGGNLPAFQQLVRTDPELEKTFQAALEPLSVDAHLTRDEEELRLVGLAYLAGWGPEATRAQAETRLREMAEQPRIEALAYEMLLTAYLQRRDIENCEATLKHLQSLGRATLANLTAYWQLLALSGRRKDAVDQIREANPVPRTDADVLRLVRTYALLEMLEEADELARRYLNDPPWLLEGALIRTDLLVRLRRWEELRQLAYRLRLYPPLMNALGGYSTFIEGVAQWHEGYRADAERSFELAARTGFPDTKTALRVAEVMIRLGVAKHALTILSQPNVQTLTNSPAYLGLRMQAAGQLRNAQALYETASALFLMAPNNPAVMNDYAAALLLLRTNVEKAVVQTFRLRQLFTNNPAITLNHAIALTMNRRFDEADALLAEISPADMRAAPHLAQYFLALYELRLRQGRKAEAQAALAELHRIGTAELFPVQVQWLESTLPELEALAETRTTASGP